MASMWIAGVSLSASSAAFLALLLTRAGHGRLAQRIDIAVDLDAGNLELLPSERMQILAVLKNPHRGLRDFRDALSQTATD